MQSVNTAFRNVRFFDAPIGRRVFYAVVAALLWWGMVEFDDRVVGDDSGGLLVYATGGVFSALVLFPYLPSVKGTFTLRAIGLLLVGVFSYWLAVRIAGELLAFAIDHQLPSVNWPLLPHDVWSDWPDRYLVAIAGVYGAAIIGVGARLLVPLTLRWSGWLMVLAAGCLGGAVVGIGEEMHNGGDALVYWWPGHIAWEVLVCLALYYGSKRAANLAPGHPNSFTLSPSTEEGIRMSDQTKRLLFLILTLPGVAFPFMDFAAELSPFEFLRGREFFTTGASDGLCVWVVFAPIALLLLDSWRLLRPAPRPVVVLVLIYGLVTGALFLWELITGITGGFRELRGLDIATLGIGVGSIATTAVLVYCND